MKTNAFLEITMVLKQLGLTLLVAVLFASSGAWAHSQQVVVTDDELLPLTNESYFLESGDAEQSVDDVMGSDQWKKVGSDSFSKGYSDSAWWIKSTISNPSDQALKRLISLNYPLLDNVKAYLVNGQRVTESIEFGQSMERPKEMAEGRRFAFPVTLEPGQSRTILFRIDTKSAAQGQINLWQDDAYYKYEIEFSMAQGMFFGAMVLISLYNLLLFLSIRDPSYLYYFGFVASTALFCASITGYGELYLWGDYVAPEWNNQSIVTFMGTCFTFAALFTNRFLSLGSLSSRAKTIANLFAISGGFVFAASFIVPYSVSISLSIPWAIFGCALAFTAGLFAWAKGQDTAKYYVGAWTLFLIGCVITALNKMGVLPVNWFTNYAIQLGLCVEVLALSFALAHRMNTERRLRIRSQKEVIKANDQARKMLEKRVSERTQELETLNQRLNEMTITDSLTALRNRRFFDEALKQETEKANRYARPISLAMIDIDHFKYINDTYGHQFGDECLKEVGKIIQATMRESSDTASRYGGEEFALILPETSEDNAHVPVERIRQKVGELEFEYSGQRITISLSAGIAGAFECDGLDRDQMLANADEALYAAKSGGRDRIICYRDLILSGSA